MKTSGKELALFIEKIDAAVVVCRADASIRLCNAAASRLFGCSADWLAGRKFSELDLRYVREDGTQMPWTEFPVQRVLTEKQPVSGLTVGFRNTRPDPVIWTKISVYPEFEEDGNLGGLIVSFTELADTNDKEKIDRQIKQAKNEWENTVDAIQDIVVILDLDWGIVRANRMAHVISGFGYGELTGRKCFEVFHGNAEPCSGCPTWCPGMDSPVNTGLVHSSKLGRTFEVTSSPIFDESGRIKNFVHTGRDVTNEKSLERQLQQAMKMEAIGTLAGGIAHDFNNILSVMIGYGQMAKGRLGSDDPARSDIDQVLLAGDRAVDLVKQILTFSRQDTQEKFKPLYLQYVIKEVLKLLRSSLPMTIELHHSLQNDCHPILADASQMHQVLMNLCTNAKQAIGSGYGRITVNLAEIVVSEKRGLVGLLNGAGNYVDLEITDTGCGMDTRLQDRVFEPFFTTKAKDHGTGLGLAVVHGIVKKHGGEIVVSSVVGQGTTFHVYFPVRNVPAGIEQEHPGLEYEAGGNERIMVVDDEMKIAQLFQRMLGKIGYKVTIFTDSIEAISAFRKTPDAYDLVVTDMTMPKMTGAELAREVLALRPDLPVIMTTGFSENIDRAKAKRLGIKEFLLKPVKKEQLSVVVRKVLTHG